MATKDKSGYVRDVVTEPGICAFAQVHEAKSKGNYGIGKFSINLLIPKTDAKALKILTDAALKAAKDRWGDKIKSTRDVKLTINDGDEKAYEGFPGNWYIAPSTSEKPLIVGPDRQPLPEGVKVKSGDTVRLCVTVGVYEGSLDKEQYQLLKDAGKLVMVKDKEDGSKIYFRPGVTFFLNMVQRLKGGTGFSQRGNPNAFPEEKVDSQFPAGDGPEEVKTDENGPPF